MQKIAFQVWTFCFLLVTGQTFSKDNQPNDFQSGAYPTEIKIKNHKVGIEQPIALAVDVHGVTVNGVREPYDTFTHGLDAFDSPSYLASNPETNERPYAITWSADKSTAYAFNRVDRKHLISINPTNGVSTRLSMLTGYPENQIISGMAIDEDNTCYVIATDNENHDTVSYLYRCDLMTGDLTLVGTQTLAPDIHDIAATCDGELYGVNSATNELIKINKHNGQATMVGSLELSNNDYSVFTLSYDRQNSLLYSYVIHESGFHTALAQLSKTTGKASYVSDDFIYGYFVGGIQSSCADNVETFAVNPGFNGSWYNPETDGQGLMIDVFEDANLLFVAWFTFDEVESNSANVIGSSDQRWFTASGELGDDNTVELTVYSSSGGVFNDPTQVETEPVGTMTLTFDDCTKGNAEYNLTATDSIGSFPFQRIAADNIDLCESLLNAE